MSAFFWRAASTAFLFATFLSRFALTRDPTTVVTDGNNATVTGAGTVFTNALALVEKVLPSSEVPDLN